MDTRVSGRTFPQTWLISTSSASYVGTASKYPGPSSRIALRIRELLTSATMSAFSRSEIACPQPLLALTSSGVAVLGFSGPVRQTSIAVNVAEFDLPTIA